MLNQKSITRAAGAGIGLAVLFSVVGGISTWFLRDDSGSPITIEQWVDNKVGA